ncbi:hypothetical protein MTBSS4_110035 [Magnetospirillum sp. SS-4]|nr:hypothetical protein MTBSS4_110035 [Magnetospirillum sp. SS-4]
MRQLNIHASCNDKINYCSCQQF